MWGNMKYTPPQRLQFRLCDFSGGICNIATDTKIKDNEASDLLNARYDQDGILKKRGGFHVDMKFSELLTGLPGTIYRVFPIEPPNTGKKGYLLLIDQKTMAYITTDGRVKKMPWSRTAVTSPIDGCQFGDKFLFVDGGVYINFFKITELEAPTSGTNKVYHYLITKPWGTPIAKPAVRGEFLEKDYNANFPNVKSYCYQPCQYEIEDTNKGTNECERFFATMIRSHKDRLYVSGHIGRANETQPNPNMIYISDVLNPAYFPASLPIQTPPDGDKITCLRTFNDALVIGRKDDIYVLTGNTNMTDKNTLYNLKKINSHTGIANNYCADNIFNTLFFMGSDGNAYRLTTTTTSEAVLATAQLNTRVDFKLPPFNKTIEEIKNCHTAFDPIRLEWFVQIGNDTLIYNYRNFAWLRWKGVECIQFIPQDDLFYYIKSDGSFNVITDTLYYDTSPDYPELKLPIYFYWASKNLDFGQPSRVKQIRDTFLVSELVGELTSNVMVKYEIDYVSVSNDTQISSEIAKWNLAKWDLSRYVAKNTVRSSPIIVGRRCRNFKVFLSNSYQFKGVVSELPSVDNSVFGDLYYLRNNTPTNVLSIGELVTGGISGTNNSNIDNTKHLKTLSYTAVNPNTSYDMVIQSDNTNLVTTILMYDSAYNLLGAKYVSFADGYMFKTLANTSYIKLSITDPVTQVDLNITDIKTLIIREFYDGIKDEVEYPDGYYLRSTRDLETRLYFRKMYDVDLFQPIKIHEINGLYEFKGYR